MPEDRVVRTSIELQAALHEIAPGETITLAPGEYAGPIILNKPVILRGSGELDRQTVLWRRGGPIIYSRAAAIRLERLTLERTVQTHGPVLIHEPGCLPMGKESMEVSSDTLINLGELTPGLSVTVPVELTVSARTEITVTGLHGATVTPSVLNKNGPALIQLSLDGNTIHRGELLLGEITLREGSQERYLWVSGLVSDAPLPEGRFCLAAKKLHIHPAPTGLTLDHTLLSQVAQVEGSAALGSRFPEGRYGLIQQVATGTLFLYLPTEPPLPVLLNGMPAVRGVRTLLRPADRLSINGLDLTLVELDPLPIQIEPTTLTFADFDTKFPEALSLKIHTGKSVWRGQLIAAAPWLTISPAGNLRLSGSKAHTWLIGLNEQILAMPDGQYETNLMLISATDLLTIPLQLKVNRPDVVLRTRPVNAGNVEYGWRSDQLIDIYIENFGRAAWSGTVRSNVPWLNIVTPMPVSGESWSETHVVAEFVPAWEGLQIGVHEKNDALTILASDGEHPVPVTIQVGPALGHLMVLTPLIKFDQVERGAPSLPEATLQVQNEGAGTWMGSIHTTNNWVQVQPAELTIAPGATAIITVGLLDVPADQPLDVPWLIDELQFDSGEKVDIQLTIVELPPHLVTRPVNFPPFVRGDPLPDGLLTIYNLGPSIWRGTVKSNVNWLNAPDQMLNCEPNESLDIYMKLADKAVDSLSSGLNRFNGAITVTGGRDPLTVPVQVDLRDASLELVLETPTLNFGQVNGANLELPTEIIRLLNASLTPWKGKIEIDVPWLSLEGESRNFEIELPKTSVAEFKVFLNEAARWLPPGLITEDKAITIFGNTQRLSVRVLLALIEWTPRLEVKPHKLTVIGDAAQKMTIRNIGSKQWPLQISSAPWLQVTPTSCSIEPGKEQIIEIKRLPEQQIGITDDPRAIVIIGQGHETEIRVEVRSGNTGPLPT